MKESKYPPRYTPAEVAERMAKMSEAERIAGTIAIVRALIILSAPATAASPGIRKIQ